MTKGKKKKSKKDRSPEMSDQKIKMGPAEERGEPPKKSEKPQRANSFWGLLLKKISTKKAFIAILIVFVLCLGAIALKIYFSQIGFSFDSAYSFPNYEGPVLDSPSPLTGVMTTKEKSQQKVVGVMIENHPASRPQSGLSEAGLVYETLVEGGITRFIAFYLEEDNKQIGPVRSARSYYLPWVSELEALYAHVGGSDEALELIDQYGLNDLNQFFNSSAFWRDSSRFSPHNVYTTAKGLRKAGKNRGYQKVNNFNSWQYKDEEEKAAKPVSNITIDYSGTDYKVGYDYIEKSNVYRRLMAGSIHKDLDGDKIKPKNLVVQETSQIQDIDGVHLDVEVVGSGNCYIFTDGRVYKGSWKKENLETRTKYFKANGEEFEFNRGSTWVHVVSSLEVVGYSK